MSKQSGTYMPVTVVGEDPQQHVGNYELTACLVGSNKVASGTEYSNLPEAQNLTWEDSFFDDDSDVVAVFDFDYEAMEEFNTSVGWTTLACTILYPPFLALSLIGLTPCYLRSNARWNARAQHVAITRDGIRFVRDRRQCCWGMKCTDQGKTSKTVPFDKITDCDLQEPAGNTCCFIPNVLTNVNIDTASSGGAEGQKELKLVGLKDPQSFKRLVWAMKRAQQNGIPITSQPPGAFSMSGRNFPQGDNINSSSSDENVASLLRDIRDQLRQNNDLLQKLKPEDVSAAMLQQQQQQQQSVVSVPLEHLLH